jgi:hypothetical protein
MERKKSQNPDPLKARGSATRRGKGPGKCNSQCLVDDVQEWYYSTEKKCQLKNGERVGHPRSNCFEKCDLIFVSEAPFGEGKGWRGFVDDAVAAAIYWAGGLAFETVLNFRVADPLVF